MIRSLLVVFLIVSHTLLFAQFNWQWSQQLTAQTQPGVSGMHTDAEGNTVLCGQFYGTLIIGSLPALTSTGQSDIYVAKFDTDGTPIWVRSIGGTDFDEAFAVTVDGAGRISITGYFQSPSVTVGSTTLNRQGIMDILVAQFTADGDVTWAKRYGWSANSGSEWGRAIVAEANGDLYVAGQYRTALVVPGLTDLQACNGRDQGFLMKLDADGNGIWSLMPQCTNDDALGLTMCNALALDPDGNVFLGGHFRGDSAFFATDTLANVMVSGQSDDAFVVKYTADGEELWVKPLAGTNYDEIESIAADSEGNILVATVREGPYLIDGIDLPISGNDGIYRMTLWKFDPNGTAVWGRRAGNTTYYHEILDIAVDANDDVWAGGYYESRCTFEDIDFPNNGPEQFNGLFNAHYAGDGTLQEVYTDRARYPRRVNQLDCDATGGLYMAGGYRDSIAFAPLPYLMGDGTYLVKSDDLTTWVRATPGSTAWSIGPVPVADVLTVRRNDNDAIGALAVFDCVGRRVLGTTINASVNEINVSDWPSGTYTVRSDGAVQRITVVH